MVLRTYAIYHQSRLVLIGLGTLCFLCMTSMMVVCGLFTSRLFFHENLLVDLLGYDLITGLGCLKVSIT